jgi:triacylglycerol lipase
VQPARELTGASRVHIVGHSLGGWSPATTCSEWAVPAAVGALVTLGNPHGGSRTARRQPHRAPCCPPGWPASSAPARLEELTLPARGCSTRFPVVPSRMDQVIVPQHNARLGHPDLDVEHLELRDVGHFSLPIDPRALHRVATGLARSDSARHPSRSPRGRDRTTVTTLGGRSTSRS